MRKLWNNKEYPLKDLPILTDQVLENYINLFWKDIMSNISKSEHVLLILRVKFEKNQIASLCNMQVINNNNKDNILLFIKDRFNLSNEAYKNTPVSSIIFSYGIREGEFTSTLENKTPKNVNYQTYYRNELPIAKLPDDYGLILSQINNTYTISINRGKKNAIINLTVKKLDNQTVNHIKYFKNNNLLFTWTDTILKNSDKEFM
jgi:transcriptional accessory protein Tex/SPT6